MKITDASENVTDKRGSDVLPSRVAPQDSSATWHDPTASRTKHYGTPQIVLLCVRQPQYHTHLFDIASMGDSFVVVDYCVQRIGLAVYVLSAEASFSNS